MALPPDPDSTDTWAPKRGVLFKLIAWTLLALIALSLLAMLILGLTGAASPA